MSNILGDVRFPNIFKTIGESHNPREAYETLRSAVAVMDELVRSLAIQHSSYRTDSTEAIIAKEFLQSVNKSSIELRNRFNISRMMMATNDPYRVSAILESVAIQLEQESNPPFVSDFQPTTAEPIGAAEPIGGEGDSESEDPQEQENEKVIEDEVVH